MAVSSAVPGLAEKVVEFQQVTTVLTEATLLMVEPEPSVVPAMAVAVTAAQGREPQATLSAGGAAMAILPAVAHPTVDSGPMAVPVLAVDLEAVAHQVDSHQEPTALKQAQPVQAEIPGQ